MSFNALSGAIPAVLCLALLFQSAQAAGPTPAGGPLDAYEPDDGPFAATYLEGFDFFTDSAGVTVQQVHTFHSADDSDWIGFQQTFNYPTSWVLDEPNTRLYLQVCDGVCDGAPGNLALNVTVFDESLVFDPQAAPYLEINACPGVLGDLSERLFPNLLPDKFYFIRIRECSGRVSPDSYQVNIRRESTGIDLHVISGQVTIMDSRSQIVPAPAYAVITSNYNDLTFANPTNGNFQLGVLAADFASGSPITNLVLSIAPSPQFQGRFDSAQIAVPALSDGGTTILDVRLNLFRSGFE